MKCKECNACKKGYFKSKPNEYVCIGVQEPFIINDTDSECTEYPTYHSQQKTLKTKDN